MIWGFLIPGWVKRLAIYAVAGAVAVLGIFAAGKREGRLRAKTDALEADRKADRRIDNADVSRGDTNSDRDWLHKRSKR